jgi:hypothetical protein
MIDRQSAFPPDFLILGAQKCGTSSMASALRLHPDIYVPRSKEAHHFGFVDDDEVGGSHYQSFFAEWAGQSVVGEATPRYLSRPRSAEQICRYLPEVKAIVLLRNPIDRAYSAYWHGWRVGQLRGGFGEAVESDLADGRPDPRAFEDIVRRGQYAEQLQRYIDLGFEEDRMLILRFDEILRDATGALLIVQEFLGVDTVLTEFPHLNEARGTWLPRFMRKPLARRRSKQLGRRILRASRRPLTAPPMDSEVRALLVSHYRPWNDRLSVLLGRDFSDWDH